MPLKQYLLDDLVRIKYIVSTVDDAQFVQPLHVLSGSSIGQHIRHIVEFYSILTKDEDSDEISYDNRKRDKEIETDRHRCLKIIDSIICDLDFVNETKGLIVVANYDDKNIKPTFHASTVSRELGYVLEHSIHHQAIIKIGLLEMGRQVSVDMGVAPATLRFNSPSVRKNS